MAAHPGVVVRVAFVSPGPIDRTGAIPHFGMPYDIMAFLRATRPGAMPHFEELDRLLAKDVHAAYAFAPDAEMDPVLDDFVNIAVSRETVHDPAEAHKLVMHGMGWWSYLMTNWDLSTHPFPVQQKLAGNRTPGIVVRAESDYIASTEAEKYLRVFPVVRMIRIAKAGHIIWLEQPKALTEALESVIFAPQ
jgi:hypothetical protein